MKMKRAAINIGEQETRHTVKIEDDPSDNQYSRQFVFLRNLLDTPNTLTCGPSIFQKLVIYYNGSNWVAEAEAVVRRDP